MIYGFQAARIPHTKTTPHIPHSYEVHMIRETHLNVFFYDFYIATR